MQASIVVFLHEVLRNAAYFQLTVYPSIGQEFGHCMDGSSALGLSWRWNQGVGWGWSLIWMIDQKRLTLRLIWLLAGFSFLWPVGHIYFVGIDQRLPSFPALTRQPASPKRASCEGNRESVSKMGIASLCNTTMEVTSRNLCGIPLVRSKSQACPGSG